MTKMLSAPWKSNAQGSLIVAVSVLLVLGSTVPARSQGSRWNTNWRFRVPISVNAAGYDRYDKPAEQSINFTTLLSGLGESGSLDENSIRLIEVTSGGAIVDTNVGFQFDKDADYNASNRASGTMVIIMKGGTTSGATRYFHVYFDLTGKSFAPPSVAAQVTLTDNIVDEGQQSYRVVTPTGTYWFHKEGAAFQAGKMLMGTTGLATAQQREAQESIEGSRMLCSQVHRTEAIIPASQHQPARS